MSESINELTIVIPAYNEAQRLPASLEKILEYADSQDRDIDILVVDDGSTDDTVQVAREVIGDHVPLTVLVNDTNRGKGYSVARGMRAAGGECVLFSDADLSTPIEEADALLAAIEKGADIAIGSRHMKGSSIDQHQPWLREKLGRLFGYIVGTLVVPGIYDTQCGFKCFRRQVARDVFGRTTLEKWAFDVEVLIIARKLGYEIARVPVRWINDAATKVNVRTEGPQMLVDLWRAKWRHRNLRPDADRSQ